MYILSVQKAIFPNGSYVDTMGRSIEPIDIETSLELGDPEMDDLLAHMLDCNPDTRWSAIECLNHSFFQGEPIPRYPSIADHTFERHHMTEEMATVFDEQIDGCSSYVPFFLGLDILMRVCATKPRSNTNMKNLAICCYNMGQKFFYAEHANCIKMDMATAKRMEFSIIEKLKGRIYRRTIYSELQSNHMEIYKFLMAPDIFPCKFSSLLKEIKKQLPT